MTKETKQQLLKAMQLISVVADKGYDGHELLEEALLLLGIVKENSPS